MRIIGCMLVGSLLFSLMACDDKSKSGAETADAADPASAAASKVYSPSELRTTLVSDADRTSPLWGKTVTVKGVALNGAVATNDTSDAGIDKFVSLELADTAEEGGLGDIECRFESGQPAVKKGATVTVTGTPDKDAVLTLLSNCAVK
jgi:hypothetical protein